MEQALAELEKSSKEYQEHLSHLYFVKAKKVHVSEEKCAVVITVPCSLLKAFQRYHDFIIHELEKKLSGRHRQFVIVGQRSIQKAPKSRYTRRPRHRTLTIAHENLLQDVCFPAEIIGKRTRIAVNGSKKMRVILDQNRKTDLEGRVDMLESVYKDLTGKDVKFEFGSS
eukprot:TRINITY_DN1035_c0_g1_i1.p1 TRINITY_DN1035_c0_g1~~TRINITY_DN1035_c0_g1_i1.p1  ORF type:complete len:169 (-),score=46.73 TRINITY_DN1035_c0_g1_i1:74-580(-)